MEDPLGETPEYNCRLSFKASVADGSGRVVFRAERTVADTLAVLFGLAQGAAFHQLAEAVALHRVAVVFLDQAAAQLQN